MSDESPQRARELPGSSHVLAAIDESPEPSPAVGPLSAASPVLPDHTQALPLAKSHRGELGLQGKVAGELEVTAENWPDLQAAGYRHFLNVAPEKLAESEFLALTKLASPMAFGGYYCEESKRPLDDHRDLGLYVLRPEGWEPF
jgi:hypothetical protein